MPPVMAALEAPASAAAAPTPPTPSVAAVVLVTTIDHRLVDSLLGLADQTRRPECVRILDATPAGDLAERLARNAGLGDDLPSMTVERLAPGTDLRDALASTAAELDTDAVWALTGHTCPEPDALRILSAALFGTRHGALAGPKLIDWDRPGRLQRFGIQTTRTGRLRLRPRAGEPDQQQYDDRLDALAVPTEGALVRRESLIDLGGFDRAFTGLAADLDLGWRAQRSGRRVVLAPGARVRIGERFAHPTTVADRRAARRVALTRCPIVLAPFLTLWVLLGSLATGLLLLLLKRPRGAAREFADLAVVADPLRGIPARWRARSQRKAGRHSLLGLFVPLGTVVRQSADRLHDLIVPSRQATGDPAADTAAGADPDTEDAMGGPAEHAQAVRNPGLWAVILTTIAAFAAGRTLPNGLASGLRDGFSGGELTASRGTAGALWHSWIDGWRGPGFGDAGPGSGGLPVLAGLVWLWDHVPFHDAGADPLGGLIGLSILLAGPLAALSAYVSARTLTRRRWARAFAGLVWSCSPLAAAGVGQGRIGLLALLVLLPPALAGLATLTRSERGGSAVAAAIPAVLLAAVVPSVLVLLPILGLAMACAGCARTARRIIGYVLALAIGAAPVIRYVAAEPARLLTGWGLLGAPDTRPEPLALALLHPSGVHGIALWWTAPIVVLGLLALVRRGAPSGPAWLGAGLVILGLTAAVAFPRIWIRQGGDLVAGWAGPGLLVALAGLLVAALHASDAEVRPRLRWLRAGLATLATGAVVTGFALTGLGAALSPARDPRPVVATDQASGPAASRTLVVSATHAGIGYAVIGREPAIPARDLTPDPVTVPAVDTAVGDLTDSGGAPPVSAVTTLAEWAVGFLVVQPPVPPAVEHRLDATDGLSRIGNYGDSAVWRIEPQAAGAGLPAPSRVRLVTGDGAGTVPVWGQHAATDTRLAAVPAGARLVVAEPASWAEHSVVRADGHELTATSVGGHTAYNLPAGDVDLTIRVPSRAPTLLWVYAAALAFLLYLAVPLGSRPRVPWTTA